MSEPEPEWMVMLSNKDCPYLGKAFNVGKCLYEKNELGKYHDCNVEGCPIKKVWWIKCNMEKKMKKKNKQMMEQK